MFYRRHIASFPPPKIIRPNLNPGEVPFVSVHSNLCLMIVLRLRSGFLYSLPHPDLFAHRPTHTTGAERPGRGNNPVSGLCLRDPNLHSVPLV